jgi:flagellar biosynthesis/type III secretory pathway protein FliH
MLENDINDLIAELEQNTIYDVLLHAILLGREQGYQKGKTAGYLEGCDEAEWRINIITNRLNADVPS